MADTNGHTELEVHGREIRDVTGHAVTLRQGRARSVSAEDVTIRQGCAMRVQAGEVEIKQGCVGIARAQEVEVTGGGIGVAVGEEIELDQAAATVLAARGPVKMDQAAAGVLVATSVSAHNSAIGVLLTPQLTAEGVRVLLGVREALALGAGFGLVVGLLRLLRRR